ncbi:NapC/NirT family cytochrome c [Geomonas sp. Red32]|uniref:NapC/NirT family cytochrome c n=1 Tax=Geomonas sp. Red32 TaxID=2912856 RepID=UPI00202D0171|nr:NapC/NirT family cytochrome c [Geomonas sp. Red32]MCM0082545.1 NapC/NirT family cytochrome c [Geomonas sp. Red32]
MRNSLTKLHYLLFVLFMVAMTGCGANNAATPAASGDPGSISAKLQWRPVGNAAHALVTATVPGNVANILFTVTGTGTNGSPVPVVKSLLPSSTTTGSIGGVYPGTVALSVKALDSNNQLVYEGFALNVAVTANNTTNVGNIAMTPPVVKAEEQTCLGCHENTLDATGQNIVANYKSAGHYTNVSFTDANGVRVGCVGCHGASHNIPDPSAGGAAARCFDCHTDKVAMHFNNYTGAGVHAAMFVPTNEACTSCHQFHNSQVADPERVAWAASAHGDINGAAWASEDMQAPGQIACQRCHTGTGFKNFAKSNFQTFPTTSIAAVGDHKREVLGCDGCHTDNTFAVRQVGAFTTQYKINNNSVTATFPDVGESNLCIACHSARENGVDAVTDFTNASFKNSHYLAAAGLMYMSTGFTQFTSASAVLGTTTYGKTLSPDNVTVPGFGIAGGVSSTHRKLGTTLINGDTHNPAVFIPGQFDANGPCVTCHLNANGAPAGDRAAHGHTLAIDANTYNQVCTNCHGSENTIPLNSTNFQSVFIEPQSSAFQSTIKLAVTLLAAKGIDYDSTAYPYFFKHGLAHTNANQVKDWTLGTGNQAFGKKMMGACFNINLLNRDPAAYAHARSYSRRLLYDSIDFLDDGVMNLSAGASALASGLTDTNGNLLFTKGTNAYNVSAGAITTIYTGTSEAMLYLLGWSRSTGLWSSPERP